MATINKLDVNKIHPLKDNIIVSDMVFGERISKGGLVILDDDKKLSGIRPRWGKVFAVGPEVSDINVGQYIYVAHGRWTRGITIETPEGEKVIRKVDNKDILLVSDEYIPDCGLSDNA